MLWRRFAESRVVSIGVEHRLVELVHGDRDATAGVRGPGFLVHYEGELATVTIAR